ncbi:MAG TPA: serpin family protein [Candidatus Ozemobacteraceae bacterium]|nr:serpin family protein [Candidatus Ozemobacteraceae bacterium]HQG29731.1 serpin family protein [Candidatus Ozemobacteraceae bacterium]
MINSRRLRASRWFVILMAAVLAWSGCGTADAADDPRPADVKQVAAGVNALGLKLLSSLSAAAPGNLFFSPFSIHIAFAMPFAGAAGETRAELAKTFAYPVDGQGALAGLYGDFIRSFPGFGGTPAPADYKLSVANAIWAHKPYPFASTYLDLIKTTFASEIRLVDFAADYLKTRLEINAWVEAQTQNLIKDLIPEGILNTLTRLVLVNAVYFKGTWVAEFPKDATADASFFVDGKTETKVPMMRQTGEFRYADGDAFQALRLPYKGDTLAMYVFLPKECDGISKLETALAEKPFAEWLSGFDEMDVRVSLPKFKMESGCSLVEALRGLGVNLAFDEQSADFSGMLDAEKAKSEPGLFISAALHKAFVKVDEEGTEAAAATAVVMQTKSVKPKPIEFKADHPFLFFIVHEPTTAVLFLGRMSSPEL